MGHLFIVEQLQRGRSLKKEGRKEGKEGGRKKQGEKKKELSC